MQKGKSPQKPWAASLFKCPSYGNSNSQISTSQALTKSQSMHSSVGENAIRPSVSTAESQLWVDKHKPTSVRQIIGQQGDKSNAKKLLYWIEHWRENYGKKPACKLIMSFLKSDYINSIYVQNLIVFI